MTRRIRITVVPREPFDLDRFIEALLELARMLDEEPSASEPVKPPKSTEEPRHD